MGEKQVSKEKIEKSKLLLAIFQGKSHLIEK